MAGSKYPDLKKHIHCLQDIDCNPNECDYWEYCVKIREHHRKGEILWNRKWRKATKRDLKRYRDMFGDEWVREHLDGN